MWYNAHMTNSNYSREPNNLNDARLMYDSAWDEENYIKELMSEGYSEDEARRMAGDYDPDEFSDIDGDDWETDDIPDANDFVDEEDFD
jgi:hypothetical protein